MQKKDKSRDCLSFGRIDETVSGWQNALPLGNGLTGALIKMAPKVDAVSFNLSGAIGGGSVGVLPDVSDKIKEVRNLMAGNNPVVAGITIGNALKNKKYNPSLDYIVPIGDLVVNFLSCGKITAFSKELKLSTEEAVSCYKLGDIKIEKRSCVSFKDDLFYYEVTSTGEGGVDLSVGATSHGKNFTAPNYNEENVEDFIEDSLNVISFERIQGDYSYGVVARVLADSKATLSSGDGTIRILGAEKVLIVAKAYYGKTKEKKKDKIKSELLALRNVSYEKAFKEHLVEFGKKWGKQEINLYPEKDDFVENKYTTDYVFTLEKLFYMAKYLIATGFNAKNIQPFTSGLWEYVAGNTGSMVNTSVTLPMLYSLMLKFNESEIYNQVNNYVSTYKDDTKKIANRIYKGAGQEFPNTFILKSLLPAKIDGESLSTIVGGATIANLLYDYFLYTKDVKFLKLEALPVMCGVADFYMSYFQLGKQGTLESVPSFSPYGAFVEYKYKSGLPQKNAVSDFVIVKSLLSNIIDAYNVYSMPVSKIIDYQNFLAKLPVKTFTSPKVCEFLGEENSPLSGGVMHLYPTFGSKEVNLYSDQVVINKVVSYIKERLNGCITSYNIASLTLILNALAVLGRADLFEALIKFIMENYLSSNLMVLNNDKYGLQPKLSSCQGFMTASNMGIASALVDTFVMENGSDVCILPLKLSKITRASISGIYLKNNMIIDLSYDDKKASMVISLKAIRATKFNLRLFKGVKKVKGYTVDPINPILNGISISAGKTITFDIKY